MQAITRRQADDGHAELVLESVDFQYTAGAVVVHSVSGALRAGRLVALIGPNAAGKSTLLRLMLGQLEPSAGRVLVQGHEVASLSPRRRAALISYVPQHGSLGFAFNVREVVEMGRFAAALDAGAVEHALRRCDLDTVADRVFAHLSAGQQQRVMLARAMAQADGGGRVMLLDEPGSHMDLWHVHAMMRMLRMQAEAGLAVLVVLHDLNLAARYADEVWLMHEGRLVASGAWGEVMRPQCLEPVYRVTLRVVDGAGDRPVLVVDPA